MFKDIRRRFVSVELSSSDHPSLCIHLFKGIEDAFKTAATEVSLLAGTDEFNATELFGVGKILSSLVIVQTIPHLDVLTLSKAVHPSGSSVPAHTWHSSCSGCAPLQRGDGNVQQGRKSTVRHCSFSLSVCLSVLNQPRENTPSCHMLHLLTLMVSSLNIRREM